MKVVMDINGWEGVRFHPCDTIPNPHMFWWEHIPFPEPWQFRRVDRIFEELGAFSEHNDARGYSRYPAIPNLWRANVGTV